MSKQPHSASGLRKKALEVSSPKPPHAEEHHERLLDEALAETFPTSDAIAVSLYRPSHSLDTSPPGRVEKGGGIADCSVGYGTPPEALETGIECEYRHTGIPATVALSFEGADYIYHFCGPQCLDTWCKATNAHDK